MSVPVPAPASTNASISTSRTRLTHYRREEFATYRCTLPTCVGMVKMMQIVICLIISGCVGIYCGGGSCHSNISQVNATGQGFVLFACATSLVVTFLFLFLHCTDCCRTLRCIFVAEFYSMIGMVFVFVIASIIETYYAVKNTPFKSQWAVAAALCWTNLALYCLEILYWKLRTSGG